MPHLSIPHLCPQFSSVLVLGALLGTVTAFSAEVRLAWNAPAQTGLAGYKIYYGESGKSNVTRINIGNVTTYTVIGLKVNTTHNFCVTAFYTSGNESVCSNQVSVNLWPRMYGFRDASAFSQRGDACLAGLYSRSQRPQLHDWTTPQTHRISWEAQTFQSTEN